MNPELRNCQNCKNEFEIAPEDFAFYKKIQVPPPTFCPQCRLQRRLAFFNLFKLYKRTCDLCKQEALSMYSPESQYLIYCPKCWWSDKWSWQDYGRDYDFSRPFFEQYDQLLHEVPLLGLSVDLPTITGPLYLNNVGHTKNCYLIFQGDFNEESAYCFYLNRNKEIFDSAFMWDCELSYDSYNSYRLNRTYGSEHTLETLDSAFLRDSTNCQNCFASINLRNKKYYIFNQAYSKEEYFEELEKYDLGSYKNYQEIKQKAQKHWRTLSPKPLYDDNSVDITGNNIYNSKNCKECYEVVGAENSKYLLMMAINPVKDCYDITSWGNNISQSYEGCMVGEGQANTKAMVESGLSLNDAEYSRLVFGGSNIFGCVGIRKGEYCIFNKRYTKEEFGILRKRIIKHMHEIPYTDQYGRNYTYGEFFPIELSSFAYNETLAQKIFPLTKDQALNQGYSWREQDKTEYALTILAKDLPDHIKQAPDSILNEVIGCSNCSRGYKIIPTELIFLRNHNLPLPRLCPFCRIDQKFELWRKDMQLNTRRCAQCDREFQTPHSEKDYPYIVCKEHYNQSLE